MVRFRRSFRRVRVASVPGSFLAALVILYLLWLPTSAQQKAGLFEPTAASIPENTIRTGHADEDGDITGGFAANEDSWNVELVGRWIGGECLSMAVQNSIAYCGVGGGLIIVDFSSRGAPVELGRLPLPDITGAVEPVGQYAYVANHGAGLRIIDILDPAHPVEVGFWDTPSSAQAVAVDGNYAYIADYDAGLRVIDISIPTAPLEVGFYDKTGRTWDVAVSGDYAYVAESGGLRVIDVSDPTDPQEVGLHMASIVARSVVVRGGYAYVAAGFHGLRVIDVSVPSAPVEVGFHDAPLDAVAVVLGGDFAYLAATTSFRVLDISDPTSPQDVAALRASAIVNDVAISGDLVYVSNARRGARVMDVSDPSDPQVVDTYVTGNRTGVFAVNRGYVYLPQSDGLWVLDVTDPAAPSLVATSAIGAGAIVADGDYAYTGDGETFRVIDISVPDAPSETGAQFLGNFINKIVVEGNHAYVANGFNGLRVLDISDPGAPAVVGSHIIHRYAADVTVRAGYAYVKTDSSGLRVIDVTDPAAPAEVGSFELLPFGLGQVAVDDHYAYVTSEGEYAVHMIDVTDPAAPREVGVYQASDWPSFPVVSGKYVCFCAWAYGLQIIDVSDPAAIVQAGSYPTPYDATRVVLSDGLIYLSDLLAGLFILDFNAPEVSGPYLDIKPGTCPNPLNVSVPRGHRANGGVLPVAVLGGDDLDVRDIDVASLELEGAAPLRHGYEDVGTPADEDGDCVCSEAGPDGITDLTLKFRRLDVVAGLGSVSGDDVPVTLTGQMNDGTPINLTDCVRIVPERCEDDPPPRSPRAKGVTGLGRATPNPFNPTTVIDYELVESGHVRLRIYDVQGKLVATLVDAERPAGLHAVTWDAKGMHSGVYFCRLEAGDVIEVRKIVLLK